MSRTTFIGASGWLGSAIGTAILRANLVPADCFTAVNRSGVVPSAYVTWPTVVWETDTSSVSSADIVFLSVRPDQFRTLEMHCPDALVISLLSGTTISEIRDRTSATRVVRAMPNAAVEIGKSYTPWFASASVTASERQFVDRALATVGTTDIMEAEDQIDIITALSGTGPAYAAVLTRALARAGNRAGLSKTQALRSANAIICDASQLLGLPQAQADEIIERLCSYKGPSATVIETLLDNGIDETVEDGLTKAIETARRIGKL